MATKLVCQSIVGLTLLVAHALVPAHALTIDINFVSGYFSNNSTAVATIEKAAADVSAAITSPLTQVNQNDWDVNVGGTTVGFEWVYAYTNPATGESIEVNPGYSPSNNVTVLVGDNLLGGNTLGTGTPGGLNLRYSYSRPSSNWNNYSQAVTQLNSLSEAEYRRGGKSALTTRSASIGFDVNGNGSADVYGNLNVDYAPAYGSMALDVDTNNNNVVDTSTQLEAFWHLDYATPVPAGKNDLYSLAVHELLHVLGVGSSTSWENLHSGTTWLGGEAIAEWGHGTGANLISGNHLAQNVMSRSIVNGAPQEVIMDPNITTGTRKYLTTLDLAILRDLGYETIANPDFGIDGDYNEDGTVDASDYTLWRNSLGSTSALAADGNGNNVIDLGDYTVWKNNFGTSVASIAIAPSNVPEPTAFALAGMLLIAVGLRFRHRF